MIAQDKPGLVDRMLGWAGLSRRSINNPKIPLTAKNILSYLGGGALANSGVRVNSKTALTVSPVWQAMSLITGDISRVPLLVYRERSDGGKDRAVDHRNYRLLRKHTGEMTSNLWIARIIGHAALYGNGFSRIYWRGGVVERIEWLHRDRVEAVKENGTLYYKVRYYTQQHGRDALDNVPESDMLHVPGLTLDELGGLSLIDYARNSFGRAMAAEGFADDFFSNDATPSGFFMHPGELSPQAKTNILQGIYERHGGTGNRFKTALLEEGMEWKAAGVTPSDAMLIDMMKWSTKDVARFFNVPPHKLGDSDKVAYKSLEEENRAYFDSSLGCWVSRLEFEATYKLFHESSESQYFCEFLQDAWGKASTETRFRNYSVAIQWGIMSRNEVRIRENLNPVEGGDEFPPMHQLGGAPAANDAGDDNSDENDSDAQDDARAIPADLAIERRDLLAERMTDAVRLLGNASLRAAKHPRTFLASVNDLETRFSAPVVGKIERALHVTVGADAEPQAVARTMFDRCSEDLLTASECSADQLKTRVEDTVTAWPAQATTWATELVLGGASHE